MASTAILRVDHECICGDAFSFDVVADASLVGASLRCTVKRRLANGDAAAVAVATSDDGIALDPGDGTRAIVSFAATVTADWPTGVELHVDVQALQSGSSVRTLARGSVTTHHRVTLAAGPTLTQTLPAGFDVAFGGTLTAHPFNTPASQTHQWHYDSGQFYAQRSLLIRDVAIRGQLGNSNAFAYPSLEVVLAESSTDYKAASHVTTFADNILRSKVVRPAAAWSGAASSGFGFVSFGLTDTFRYDPSTGNDLIVQLRTCGVASLLFGNIDGESDVAGGDNGGNRYANLSSCSATVENFRNNQFVPIVLISYG